MGKLISFFNTKGGTGKSTLSYLLYKHFNNNYFLTNLDFIKAIDDPNILHFTDLKDKELQQQFLDNLKTRDAIIDTRGSLLNDKTIYYFIKKSNLIVVPAYADVLNLRQTFVVLKDLQKINNKILLVFNKYNEEQEETIKEFLDFLNTKNIKILDYTTVKNYKSYVKAIENKDYYLKGQNKFLDYVLRNAYNNLENLHNKIQNLI